MTNRHPLSGIYAAALTPFKADHSIDVEAVTPFLHFLAAQECHGVLLFGTTGEGPSLSPSERTAILQAATDVRITFPEFRLLAGTGTPSLDETVELTRKAFDLGCEGVVVLPPYYYRKVSDEGLFAWFQQVITRAVPKDGYLLGYHIPGQTGIPLSLELLERLKQSHPQQFAGIKDSSGDPEYAIALGARFGSDLLVLTGNDGLFLHALEYNAGGAITAMANLYSPLLRQVWDIFIQNGDAIEAQEQLNLRRRILDRYQPFPPTLKALLARLYGFERWGVRPPLLPISSHIEEICLQELCECEQPLGN
ncbi:MAG TPA: dihydrodipicolinate synthase family protein [Anaerolineales bacterium]|jgi:4-hydroxy-tetrahydrodipicolinate synthase